MHLSLPRTTPVTHSARALRLTNLRTILKTVKALQGSGSYDSDSDELLREFQRYTDPKRVQKATKRLELTWGVQRVGTSNSIFKAFLRVAR